MFQGQLEAKSRQLENVSSQLKKAERSVEDYESHSVAPTFATPQKRESARFATTPAKQQCQGGENEMEALKSKLHAAERKLEERDREVKDLETRLFENATVTKPDSCILLTVSFQGSSLISFDEQPISASSASSFDDMPLPATVKSAHFGDIANRAKSSSIAFDYTVNTLNSSIFS